MSRATSAPAMRTLWWLHPTNLFACVGLITVGWACAMPRMGYRLYDTPKYIDISYFYMALLGTAAFAIGGLVASKRAIASPSNVSRMLPVLRRCFWITVGLTFFAYAVWLLIGVRNGFRPGLILEFLKMGDGVETFEFKERIFPTVPGVTTLTQCGMVAVILGMLPDLRRERYVLPVVLLIIGVAFVRGLMLSERIAFIELVLPAGLIYLRTDVLGKITDPLRQAALRAAPVVGVVMLFVLFGTFEYYRSYKHYESRFNNIGEFTAWRISAYYTLGHNNSALVMKKRGGWPLPYPTVSAFWTFPLIKKSPLNYEKLTHVDVPTTYSKMLRLYASEEYNNDGGLFAPYVDYGPAGFALFWLAFGYAAVLAYRSYLAGNIAGLCFYPLLFLTLLEVPRYFYLGMSRATPQIVIFCILSYLAARAATPVRLPMTAGAKA